jgi:hypothetical protein
VTESVDAGIGWLVVDWAVSETTPPVAGGGWLAPRNVELPAAGTGGAGGGWFALAGLASVAGGSVGAGGGAAPSARTPNGDAAARMMAMDTKQQSATSLRRLRMPNSQVRIGSLTPGTLRESFEQYIMYPRHVIVNGNFRLLNRPFVPVVTKFSMRPALSVCEGRLCQQTKRMPQCIGALMLTEMPYSYSNVVLTPMPLMLNEACTRCGRPSAAPIQTLPPVMFSAESCTSNE